MRASHAMFALLLISTISAAVLAQDEVVLESAGLPAGEPEKALPRGAVLHIRINGLEPLLSDVDALVREMVPQDVLPQEDRDLLKQKNFLLAIIGRDAMGAPLNAAQLSGILGIDLNRPITLSVYPQISPDAVALALPMKDPAALTSLLQGMFDADEIKKDEFEGRPVFFMDGNNPDLPQEILIACSDDTAYVLSHPGLLEMLMADEDFPRMSASPLIQRGMPRMSKNNIAILLDPDFIQPMLPQLKEMNTLPPDVIEGLREELLSNLTEDDQMVIEQMLREQLGIRDVHQGMDYAECVLTASYEILFQYLFKQAEGFDGVMVGVDLSGRDQSIQIALLSETIKADDMTAPIDMKALSTALKSLPGEKHLLIVNGKQPKAEQSAMFLSWLDRIEQKMEEKELPLAFIKAVKTFASATQPLQPLSSRVPWTAETRVMSPAIKSIKDFDSMEEYITYLSTEGLTNALWANIKAMPKQSDSLLEKHFVEMAKTTNDNDAAYRKFLGDIGQAEPFYRKFSESHREKIDGDVSKLVYENHYVTKGGLFGYNEHELINRQFILYRHVGRLTFVHEGAPDATMLQSIGGTQPSPAAVMRLLGMAPKNTTYVEIARLGDLPVNAVDYLVDVEALAHREVDAYLKRAQKVYDDAFAREDEDALFEGLAKLEMPMIVSQVKVDTDAKKVYAVIGPGIAYPRPKIMPALRALLDDYAEQADDAGGVAMFKSVDDGEMNLQIIFDAGGFTTLQRTLVNNAYNEFGSSPEGQEKLEKLFMSPLDERVDFDPTLQTNPAWQGIIEGLGGGGFVIEPMRGPVGLVEIDSK